MNQNNSSVRERWRKEIDFHDQMAKKDTRWTAFRDYGLSSESIEYAKSLIGDPGEKVILDLGCGDGTHTVSFIQDRARVLACDLSYPMAKATLRRLHSSNGGKGCVVSCQQMAAEEMGYASSSIDIIFGVSVLHHLEISLAVPEIKRILKPGGCAIFVEPLDHNPMANIYRKLTLTRHSEMEKPLNYAIFDFLNKYFPKVQHKEFYLLSLFSAVFAFFNNRSLFDNILKILINKDNRLFVKYPYLRRYAWITVIKLTK